MPFKRKLYDLLTEQCELRRESPMSLIGVLEKRGMLPLSPVQIPEYDPKEDNSWRRSQLNRPNLAGWPINSPRVRFYPYLYKERYLGDEEICLHPRVNYKIDNGSKYYALPSPDPAMAMTDKASSSKHYAKGTRSPTPPTPDPNIFGYLLPLEVISTIYCGIGEPLAPSSASSCSCATPPLEYLSDDELDEGDHANDESEEGDLPYDESEEGQLSNAVSEQY